MKDELVRHMSHAALVSIAIWFAGCNGCNGCEGQTPQVAPSVANTNSVEPVPSTVPSVVAPAAAASSAEAVVQPHPDHDPTGVVRCCQTVKANLEAAPAKHRATWQTALEKCNEAVAKKMGRKGLEAVREALTQVGYPVACH